MTAPRPETPRGCQRPLPKKPEKSVQKGLGSGVILTADGYILTNNHFVDGADELKVEIAGEWVAIRNLSV